MRENPGGFDSPCVENHDISPVMGKLMCRKCGTTGLLSAFQKKRCNSNHSISVMNGVVKMQALRSNKRLDDKKMWFIATWTPPVYFNL